MPLNAKVDMSDGEQLALTGLLAVDEKKMLQLNDEKALEFYRSGELAWPYAHLISVGTINQFVTRFSNAKQDSGSKKAGESKTKKNGAEKEVTAAGRFNVFMQHVRFLSPLVGISAPTGIKSRQLERRVTRQLH